MLTSLRTDTSVISRVSYMSIKQWKNNIKVKIGETEVKEFQFNLIKGETH